MSDNGADDANVFLLCVSVDGRVRIARTRKEGRRDADGRPRWQKQVSSPLHLVSQQSPVSSSRTKGNEGKSPERAPPRIEILCWLNEEHGWLDRRDMFKEGRPIHPSHRSVRPSPIHFA